MVAEGMTNRAISETLGLAIKTVDTHRTRLMRKLDIHDQTSLVKFAIRRGIVTVR
jgi:DNA-binding NarL/FixJ family response regulator